MPISSPNPMSEHSLESSHQDDSNKWSNIRFSEEIVQIVWIEVNFIHLIWSSVGRNVQKPYNMCDFFYCFVQSNLDISKLMGLFFYKFKLPEVQINLHFG